MPLPLPVRILLVIYKYLAPYLGDDSRIKKWIVKNKLISILLTTLVIQLLIIVVETDQLFESNKQIVLRNDKIHELELTNGYLTDKNQVLTTVLDRLANGPIDELKSTETVPLPETEIKTPVNDPLQPRKDDEDQYVRSLRRQEETPMEGY